MSDFVSKVGDVIILENDERYLVLDCIIFNEKYYLSVVSINLKNMEKLDDIANVKYVEEILENGELRFLEVDDEKTIKELINLQKKYSKD